MSGDMDIYSHTFWSISPEKMIFKQNPLSDGPTKVTSSIFNSQNTLLKIPFYYHSGTSYCLHKFTGYRGENTLFKNAACLVN